MLGRAFRRLEFVFFNEHSLKLVHEVDLFSHAEGDTRASAPDQGWVLALQQELCGTAVRYVVTLGLHGAYVISAQSHCFRPSIKLDAVVDSTGAGDAFASAFITFSRLRGDPDGDALEKAHCAAAMKIQHKGGSNGHPDTETIEREWRRRKGLGAWMVAHA